MDWIVVFFLTLAGMAGGIINALAGGATLVTFPAMLAAGMPAVTANASNAVAIAPGHLIAALADREKLPVFDAALLVSVMLCIVGGMTGALILLALPDRLFILPVPALIGFATLVFACAPRISRWTAQRRGTAQPSRRAAWATLAATSIYGGFFGAGLGIILTAVLSIADPIDIRRVKVLKNLLATCVSLAAIAIFILRGAVQWPETLVMLVGALLGGYAGGYLVRILPAEYVRRCVIVAGAAMSVIYAYRYWL